MNRLLPSTKSADPMQVLVVDDTLTYRMILSSVVQSLEAMTLCGTAKDGREALQEMSRKPVDLVLLDVEMPVMNGLETLDVILKNHPETNVVLISSKTDRSAESTIQALQKGALDFITKPDGGSPQENRQALHDNLANIIRLCQCKSPQKPQFSIPAAAADQPTLAKAPEPPAPVKKALKATGTVTAPVEMVVIGVSTGGPNALAEVIPHLPADLGVPVLIVQHMPPLFTASLAQSLDRSAFLQVKEAVEGEAIRPNVVYIAPGGQHMEIDMQNKVLRESIVRLTEEAPENSCRPAVDVLFRSAAKTYGKNTLAVIMTGMGSDGLHGVRSIKEQGGYCITQSEASCVVYGMPRAVDEKHLSDEKIALHQLADYITQRVRQSRKQEPSP